MDNFILCDIGLKDINGKNIYADSSIVEFEWGQDRHNIIGYFKYNKEYLCYEIIMLNVQKGKLMCYSPHNCSKFKIIDTIQENKLNLIKGLYDDNKNTIVKNSIILLQLHYNKRYNKCYNT